jgi:hypothetical protein
MKTLVECKRQTDGIDFTTLEMSTMWFFSANVCRAVASVRPRRLVFRRQKTFDLMTSHPHADFFTSRLGSDAQDRILSPGITYKESFGPVKLIKYHKI